MVAEWLAYCIVDQLYRVQAGYRTHIFATFCPKFNKLLLKLHGILLKRLILTF